MGHVRITGRGRRSKLGEGEVSNLVLVWLTPLVDDLDERTVIRDADVPCEPSVLWGVRNAYRPSLHRTYCSWSKN